MQTSLFEQEAANIDRARPLRPRQVHGIKELFAAIKEGHKHVGFQAPPGFGKTRVSAEIIAMALRRGLKPLFTSPAISLIDQTVSAFELEGIHDIGVLQARHRRTNPYASLQVATVQTLLNRPLAAYDLIIVDEFHEVFEGLNALIDGVWKDKIVIGLSATPWTRGLGLHYSKLIIGATFRDMIEDGIAREYTIYGPEKDVDREALKVAHGEFEEGIAAEAMSNPTIVGDVLTEWKELSTQQRAFVFCVNRRHAQVQMEAFLDAGVPFGYIDANTPVGESDNERGTRKHAFAQMRHGEIAGIASVGCLIRGVDEVVYNLFDLAPTKSEIRHVQKWGRMRTSDPNATYLGFDHAGNNNALGHFADIFHDTLDSRKPGERTEAFKEDYKPSKPRKCQKCHTLVPAGVRECPTCKERLPLNTGVVVKDGRLVEIGSGPKKPKANPEEQRWYSELLHVGRKAGFKDGWAAFKFQAKFGKMPTGLKPRGKSATSEEVSAFVREERRKHIQDKKKSRAAMVEAVAEEGGYAVTTMPRNW